MRWSIILGGALPWGFDATRLTLYDRYLRPSHTLASLVIDGRETFVDSINTSAEFNAFLNGRDLSVADFSLLHYREDLEERMDLGRALQSRPASDGTSSRRGSSTGSASIRTRPFRDRS